jgi:hypothetical protein
MQGLHRGEKSKGLRFRFRSAQMQRTELFEVPKRTPELLARIGAQHSVKLTATLLQPAEINGI